MKWLLTGERIPPGSLPRSRYYLFSTWKTKDCGADEKETNHCQISWQINEIVSEIQFASTDPRADESPKPQPQDAPRPRRDASPPRALLSCTTSRLDEVRRSGTATNPSALCSADHFRSHCTREKLILSSQLSPPQSGQRPSRSSLGPRAAFHFLAIAATVNI